MTKTSFSEILELHGDPEKFPETPIYGCKSYHPFSSDRTLAGRISTWLSQHGFDDWKYFANASNTFVLQPKDNPEIVLKIHGAYDDKRCVPHLLQPLYVTTIEGVTLEFLPNVFSKNPESAFRHIQLEERDSAGGKKRLEQEVKISGYEYVAPLPGLFTFTYDDPKKPGRKKVTLMCYDHDDIEIPDSMKNISQCTSEYPSLAAQYREQDRIIANDPRLQRLIKEDPQPRYETSKAKEPGIAILPPLPTPPRASLLRRLFGGGDSPPPITQR
jgi:hypothetical protein